MPIPLVSGILRPFGLDPSQGYDTAAAGAKDAQTQANQLSNLQWQRQMQGLDRATGYVDQLQSLYNSMYSPGGGQPAAGGAHGQAINPQSLRGFHFQQGGGGMDMLLPSVTPQASQPAGGNGGTMLGALFRSTPLGLGQSMVDEYTGGKGTAAVKGIWNGIKGLF